MRSAEGGDRVDGRHPILLIGIGAALLLVPGLIASSGSPGAVEVRVFRWLNDPPGFIGAVLGLVDPLLRPVPLAMVAIGLVLLLAITHRGSVWPALLAAAASAAVAWVLDHILKAAIDRGRPPEYLDDVLTHGYPVEPGGSGFPSSHTAVVVAVVVGAWPWLTRGWRIGGVVLASAIGLDRIYVGAHLPLDVIGGVGVGLIAGGAVRAVAAIRQRGPRRA